MPGQAAILDETFVVAQSGGVARYRAVVQGTNDYEASYGAAVGAGKFLGITQEDQDDKHSVNVRMLGTSFATTMGPIAAGAEVCIGDTSGRIDDAANQTTPVVIGKALSTAAATGDQILVFIKP